MFKQFNSKKKKDYTKKKTTIHLIIWDIQGQTKGIKARKSRRWLVSKHSNDPNSI